MAPSGMVWGRIMNHPGSWWDMTLPHLGMAIGRGMPCRYGMAPPHARGAAQGRHLWR